MRKQIIAFAILALLSSCASNEIGHSKDVNQDEINQTYFINYDENKDQTKITAFFRFAGSNGTTLILDSSSEATMDGEKLQEVQDNSVGCYYHKILQGRPEDKEYTFSFTDLNGKKYENKLDFRNMQIETLPDTIKHDDGLTIYFNGKPEGRREDLTVEISSDTVTVSETWRHVYFEKVVFPKEKWNKLYGKIIINIKREGSFELKQHAHAGGYISTQYVLVPKKIVVTD